ncbi:MULTISPECIES: DUF1097 domain-containing protein [Gammaproteobacteria]|jgi:hypothetical protein|uniref:DUF1097 domain-containing protein n=1 Tax=Alloalcanivorax xenomutans TaxID=1094342 RepID=A0A9Q3ZEB8_9GAMM|nr:DUF1097 domain-containing protein [Alloalcanivorax xenomutans]ARB45277.1 hypothetical protein P40_07405 [Alloalcanivorax xenomutans]MCE7510510.1 DUF1097 domain-containing protein [Alloalcanivorax xenomutans]MCE7524781.1 DUF1097 domain-containing protein [Alloalcanivorax xenomutans]WOA32943.1 DUF1097 domain-containing protein [Alloalcanivorax xenomutans]
MANNALSDHLKIVIGESVIASSAATLSVMAFEVPVWAMFVGWISFFTRGLNLKQGVINLACVLIGVALGIAAAQVMAVLTPVLGSYAISAVVFAVTVIALSLAKAPVFNNLLGFFLGLVAYFASHQPPSVMAFGMLALAATLGAAAAFAAFSLQKKIQRNAAH